MPINVLIVDDAEVIRFLLAKSLEREPDLRVVGTAIDGIDGIEKAKELQPDVILLDIDMPRMDGLTALPQVLLASPRSKVIIVSVDSQKHAQSAIDGLIHGASAFILKPGVDGALPPQQFHQELRLTVKSLGSRAGEIRPLPSRPSLPRPPHPGALLAPVTTLTTSLSEVAPSAEPEIPISLKPPTHHTIQAVAIASSTGGPEALSAIFERLRGQLTHVPIFITQHMPPSFTTVMAETLSRIVGRSCVEGKDGMEVTPGIIYVAPGNQHMLLRQSGGRTVIRLTQDPPINSCRPSADPMFASISAVYRRNLLALVLTGIGNDGTEGARAVAAAGGVVIAQNKESSVVYGMPRYAAEAGICEAVLPLAGIASYLIKRCGAPERL